MLDQKALRRVFRDWDSLKALGENALVDLPIVRARHQAAGYSPTPPGYGLALREAFQAALEDLRPEPGPPNYLEKRWRPYIILTEQYLHGRNPDWVMDQLHVSKGTYYGEQERALEMLAGALQRQETESARQPEAISLARPAGALSMAPLRPAHPFIGREAEFTSLKGQILPPGRQAALALVGLPGVGKTALAVELAHDAQIQAHFCDGILWVGLGRQPDLTTLLGSWATPLGISGEALAGCAGPAERSALIHAAIGARRMLLVIDDAWQVDAALAFKLGGPNCAHLLTTRLVDLALDFTGGPVMVVNELATDYGLALLGSLSPYTVQTSPEEARRLVQLVGGLPLALILMGGYLQKQSFNPQRRRLRQALDRLQAAETRLQITQPQALSGLHPGLLAGAPLSLQVVIGLSDASLDDVAHRALLDLSLFAPKPNTFSEEAALATAAIPAEVLDELVDHGLLQCAAADRYTLHQTVADYAAYTVYAPYVIYTAPVKGASPEAVERMAAYYAAYVQAHPAGAPEIETEFTNLLTAASAAASAGLQPAANRLAQALAEYRRARSEI